jgi:hypothetical protein
MNSRRIFLELTPLLLTAWTRPEAAEFRVGAAQVVITPPIGAPMAGYYHSRGSDGVLDDLYAKALVLDDGSTKAVLITLDLISTTRALTEQTRAAVTELTGIPGPQILLTATHAHTGPELSNRGARDAFNEAMVGDSQLAANYTDSLPRRIAESVRLADAARTNAVLSRASGRCDGLAYNRRFFMTDGSVSWNPGKQNPDVVLPAGVTDPELTFVLIEPPHIAGQLVPAYATFVNFAMHPDTTGGARISADFPGALARRMSEYHGAKCVTLFANGTCGNLNHLDVNWRRAQSSPQEANRIATILAAAVFQAEKSLRPVLPAPLRVRSERVHLPLPHVTDEEVAAARIDARTAKDNSREGFMKLVNAFKVLDVAARAGKPLEVEVQVIALGDELAWVSLPGEVFVELGLAIKQRSPFKQTMLAELANGSIGYIPDRRAYAEGNYEPVSARCAAGSGELLVEAAVKLLGQLHRATHANPIPDR